MDGSYKFAQIPDSDGSQHFINMHNVVSFHYDSKYDKTFIDDVSGECVVYEGNHIDELLKSAEYDKGVF